MLVTACITPPQLRSPPSMKWLRIVVCCSSVNRRCLPTNSKVASTSRAEKRQRHASKVATTRSNAAANSVPYQEFWGSSREIDLYSFSNGIGACSSITAAAGSSCSRLISPGTSSMPSFRLTTQDPDSNATRSPFCTTARNT